MIVCLCFDVSDREIRAVIEQGALTVEEVGDICGAGLSCQSCHRSIIEIMTKLRGWTLSSNDSDKQDVPAIRSFAVGLMPVAGMEDL